MVCRAAVAAGLALLGCLTALAPATAVASPAAPTFLIAYADYGADNLQADLLAEPGVAAVDLFPAQLGTPTLAQMQAYDAVVTWSNFGYANATALGDNLADYADGGGIVVVAQHGADSGAGIAVGGRWASGGYSALDTTRTGVFPGASLGAYDTTSPLMQGVSTLYAGDRWSAVAAGATQAAAYTDGIPLVASKGTAVGLNAYLGSYNGTRTGWYGEFARVIRNSVPPPALVLPAIAPLPVYKPVVTAVTPSSGPAGTSVGITGDNFNGVTAVFFGATPANHVVDGYQHITASAPAGESGTVPVTVRNSAGTSAVTSASMFTYQGVTGTGTGTAPATKPSSSGAPTSGGSVPRPSAGKTGTVAGTTGYVCIAIPGKTGCTSGRSIPVGSIIDARRGSVTLVVADGRGGFSTGTFSGGPFRFTQIREPWPGHHGLRLVTRLTLIDGNLACPVAVQPRRRASPARRRVARYVAAKAAGAFRVIGARSSGIERGTQWKTTDTCEGTLTEVQEGAVLVSDVRRTDKVLVTAGHSYLAAGRPGR